jgi:hypothetical protein
MKEKVGGREARHTYGVCARGIVGGGGGRFIPSESDEGIVSSEEAL